MTIPSIIRFDEVDLGFRARSEHSNIDTLADAIEDVGLIQPLILAIKTPELVAAYEKESNCQLDPAKPYLLTAGGRRATALAELDTEFLYHGTTSEKGKPGFLIRGEADFLQQLILESQENLNRQDMDWRDQLKLMVRTWLVAKNKADEEGQNISARMFGVTLGVTYQNLEAGIRIYKHFCAHPEAYQGVTSITGGLATYMKAQANELTRVAVTRSMSEAPTLTEGTDTQALEIVNADQRQQRPSNPDAAGESPIMQKAAQEFIIPLSSAFRNVDAYAFMEEQPPGFCDHIICDPDYAIAADILDAHHNNRPGIMAEGIAQKSEEDSLRELFRLLPLAFKSIKEHGFFVFWYNINYQERLQAACRKTGFAVQSWPCIWNKMDSTGQSNAAPNHNFPKSVEFAMVCRKPATVLTRVQTSCVFTTTGKAVTKELGHAFAKPYDVWRWLYSACTQKGDIVYDPFVGSGSSAIAAITYGLRPIGTEIQPDVYQNLLINLQAHYHKLLGPNVKFK